MEHVIEKDFEEFFAFCQREKFSSAKLLAICQPLTWRMRWRHAKRYGIAACVLIALYLLYVNIDGVAWCLSAVYRIVLIQLLPFWNWQPLYNAKCVLERRLDVNDGPQTVPASERYKADEATCVLCESLEHIERVTNTTFGTLESQYLERGFPVIVADSHAPQTLAQLLDLMLNETTTNFLSSDPCDLMTNLMLPKFFDVELALQKLQQFAGTEDKWFLRFRNCRASAVRASRQFFTRPYFYPRQLEPFYTSWLLLSHNYNQPVTEKKFRLVGNLIIVVQFSGRFHIQLQPKEPCEWLCPEVNLELKAGESLLFTTDLWLLRYDVATLQRQHTSVATILEIDWQL